MENLRNAYENPITGLFSVGKGYDQKSVTWVEPNDLWGFHVSQLETIGIKMELVSTLLSAVNGEF